MKHLPARSEFGRSPRNVKIKIASLSPHRAIAHGIRFQFGSGNFYISGIRKAVLDKLNKEKLCDHEFEVAGPDTDCMCRTIAILLPPNPEINQKNTLTVGWSKFPNLQKAPGASIYWLLAMLLALCHWNLLSLLRWEFATRAAEW